MKLPKISIVILNWNSYRDTKELLVSIKKSTYPQDKIEIIIIDNASTNNSAKKLQKEFKKAQFVLLAKNHGTPARNFGIKKAKGEIIFSIDGDVSLSPETLKNAVSKIQSDPAIGVLGPLTLTKKGHHFQPSYLNLNLYTGILRPAKKGQKGIFFLAGSFHAFPKKIIKKVGLYEKKFFFYGDDLDFCLRIQKAGFKVIYDTNCIIFHGKDKSSTNIGANTRYYYYYRALFFNVARHGNLISKVTITFFQLFLMPFYKLAVKRENTFLPKLRAYWWNIANISKETKTLSLILLAGLILRAFNINKQDFWFDEAFTYHITRLPIIDLLKTVLTDNNPPLYYVFIHYWMKISQDEIWLRLPSLIASLLSIFFIYHLFKTKIGRNSALLAATLFAVSPLSIYSATQARLHSMATLLVVLLTGYFLSTNSNLTKKNVLTLSVLGILGVYTQYYFTLLFIPFTILGLLKKGAFTPKRYLIVTTIIFFSLLPWLLNSAQTMHNGCSCPSSFLSLPATLASPIVSGVGEISQRSFTKLPAPILGFFVIATLITSFFFLRGIFRKPAIASLYLIPLTVVSLAGIFIPIFSPKAFAIFSPIYIIIVSLGINSFKLKRQISLLIIAVVTLVSLIQTTNPFFKGENLKQIDKIIRSNPTATVAHTSLVTFYSTSYLAKSDYKNILVTTNPLSASTVNYIGGQKQIVDPKTTSMWLVDSPKWVDKNERSNILNVLTKNFTAKQTHQIGSLSISLLEK